MGRDLGNESRFFLEAASHREEMFRMICGVMLKDKMEYTVIASRVGLDNVEEHLRQKRLRLFGHIVR